MTALEKINAPPTRLGGTALYDWDHLVQEDRAHRLIYTDPATRLENRMGEPAANPYLYILSQVVAGLAGIEAELQPPPATDEPYAAERPMLPKNLPEALDALEKEPLFRRELGDTFIDYFIKLKRTEAGRYQRSLEESGEVAQSDEPSTWEQNEYFDFF